jgi:hypothetical protein
LVVILSEKLLFSTQETNGISLSGFIMRFNTDKAMGLIV